MGEISLNGTVYDFPVDHGALEKEDMLNIHECFMKKNKTIFRLTKFLLYYLVTVDH